MQVLVCYASRFGSTRAIATRIAEALRTRGHAVDLRSADDVSDVARYDAIVFGSGVYDGSWTAEATALMRRHASALARKPLWLFSVASFGDSHPVIGDLIKKEPKEIGRRGEGCCSRHLAGAPATTGTGRVSTRGLKRSASLLVRRTLDRRLQDSPPSWRTASSG